MRRLEDSLRRSRQIAKSDLPRLAVFEQSGIASEIQEAMKDWREEDNLYSVLKSVESNQAMASLDLETRVRVEGEIQKLTEQPHPQEAEQDQAAGYWRHAVAGTLLQILYTVDESQKQIKIINVQTLPGEIPPAGTEESRHA